jgi:hypothetical protein
MHSKLALLIAFILLLVLQARSQPYDTGRQFTLQVASFPGDASADEFIAKLKGAGERPVWGTVDLPGRGRWTRVYLGTFPSAAAARDYAESLSRRGAIKEYLIKSAREIESLGRPRTIGRGAYHGPYYASLADGGVNHPVRANTERKNGSGAQTAGTRPQSFAVPERGGKSSSPRQTLLMNGYIETVSVLLPAARNMSLDFVRLDRFAIPGPDPVQLAIRLITGEARADLGARKQMGGLWVTGDILDALDRLRWIVGPEDERSVAVDAGGRVTLDRKVLATAAGVDEANSNEDPLKVLDYICSNEGLLLLVQLTQSPHRYQLYVGRQAPTLGEDVLVSGSINLDNNFDSRINPYRRLGKKLDKERPPTGFDSLVAINPVARWFNLREQAIVPVGHITFHELAEAHAKLELDLDYLSEGSRPGAHNIALERERALKAQRPFSDVIVTTGSNRVLRSEAEIRQFYSQNGVSVSGQR